MLVIVKHRNIKFFTQFLLVSLISLRVLPQVPVIDHSSHECVKSLFKVVIRAFNAARDRQIKLLDIVKVGSCHFILLLL